MLKTTAKKDRNRRSERLKENEPKIRSSAGNSSFKKSPPDFMRLIIRKGEVTIIDYSKDDDYKAVLALFEAMGLKVKVKTESFCG